MTISSRSWKCSLQLASWLAISYEIASYANYAYAQITPDNTLGSENSTVTLTGTVDRLDGGVTRGTNLFHSFQEFNVEEGRTALFTKPGGIENILTRVTGVNPSNILGTLSVSSGNANLFLINPNGIVFGVNARLNIGGSFVGTTANAIRLTNGDIFSANSKQPLLNQLLNVNPNALLFNQIAAQQIINRSTAAGAGLEVPEGKSLLLVGGDVKLEGGQIQALGGRVELGGIASPGIIGLSINNNQEKLSFPDGVAQADVSITDGSYISVLSEDGGSISINARNFNISGESTLLAGIEEGLGTVDSQAGNIEINTTGAVAIAQSSIFNSAQGVGNSGNINIAAKSLSATDGAYLIASNYGQQGNAGNINVNARDSVFLEGSAVFSSVEELEALGKGGDINITTGSLSMTNGSVLVASIYGRGNVGNVNINARDSVFLEGSKAFSTVGPGSVGKGGDINITTGSLLMTNGSQLVTSTFGRGNAGSVNIIARDSASFDGVGSDGTNTTASSTVGSEGIGNGGGINITSGSLWVTNGAYLIGSTKERGQGNAGSVNINVRDSVTFDGIGSDGFPSAALSAVEFEGIGNGDDINITTGSLSVTNGAYLSASTFGQGNAGSININARERVTFDGAGSNGLASAAFSTVEDTAVGNGKGINITTNLLSITDGAYLSASTRGQGNGGNITLNAKTLEAVNGGQVITTSRSNGKAGNITINVPNSITISGSDPTYFTRLTQASEEVPVFEVSGRKLAIREQVAGDAGSVSGLFASTFDNSTGQGGDLRIATGRLIVRDDAEVSVSSEGAGNAGNLSVQAHFIHLDNKGSITATASSGNGGDITLQTQDLLLLRRGAQISTTAGTAQTGGNGGNITINAPSGFIVAGATENSDITANAFNGSGGRVMIKTAGIFGIAPLSRQELGRLRPDDLDPSKLPTNDINL